MVKRRLDFLKLEARGFSLCEIVKVLSEEYQTSERNIYYDAETRDTWQPVLTQLFDLDKARLMVINRYDFLYRQASLHFQTASDAQKPLYLSRMIDVTDRLVALLGLETLRETQEAGFKVAEIEKQLSKHKALLEAITRR
ncbi:MAG: hypothetical protein ACQCN5_08400 [Candidatus Bathyarchaeia archaeon]